MIGPYLHGPLGFIPRVGACDYCDLRSAAYWRLVRERYGGADMGGEDCVVACYPAPVVMVEGAEERADDNLIEVRGIVALRAQEC